MKNGTHGSVHSFILYVDVMQIYMEINTGLKTFTDLHNSITVLKCFRCIPLSLICSCEHGSQPVISPTIPPTSTACQEVGVCLPAAIRVYKSSCCPDVASLRDNICLRTISSTSTPDQSTLTLLFIYTVLTNERLCILWLIGPCTIYFLTRCL